MVDKDAPVSTIARPLDNSDGVSGRYKSTNIGDPANSTQLSGTAKDYPDSLYSGISATEILLYYIDLGTTYYYDGSVFRTTDTPQSMWLGTSLGGSGQTRTWNYMSKVNWAGDREYILEARSRDNARSYDNTPNPNTEPSPYTKVRFIVDDTAPGVSITSPTAVALKAIDRVYINVVENLAGFNYGQVRISTGTGPKYYYDGSGWTTEANTWLNGVKLGPTSYYYQIPSSILSDDVVYTIEARAYDYAGNVSVVYATYTFTYDITGPQIAINFPIDNIVYSGIKLSTPITGTTTNTQSSPNTGVSTISISISDLDAVGGARCYNGINAFDRSCPYWLGVSGSFNPWSYNAGLPYLNDRRYQIQAKATDIAGNEGNISSVVIKYDIEEPTMTITYPGGGYVVYITSVSGIATDEKYGSRNYEAKLGTHTVKIAIKRLTAPGGWWDEGVGDFNSTTPKWYEVVNNTTTTPNRWVYNFSSSLNSYLQNPNNQNVEYRIVIWGYDLAKNPAYPPAPDNQPGEGDIPADVGIIIRHDNTKPTTQITLPNAPYHNTLSTITGIAQDNIGITKVELRIYDQTLYKCYNPQTNPVWNSCAGPESAPWVLANLTVYQTSASWMWVVR